MAIPYNATGAWPSANYGDAPKYASGTRGQVKISGPDMERLRGLAEKLAELAARPSEKKKRELWYDHNSLKRTPPLLLVDPENGWNEIVTVDSLLCSGGLARRWEMVLRKELFWGESIRDDKPLEPLFEVGYTYVDTEWGMEEVYRGGGPGQSYVWEGAIQDPADAAKIGTPRIEIDQETTAQTLALAREVFGGILDVRQRGVWWWTLGLTWDLARLVGLEKMLFLFYDNPAMIHQIMAALRDGMAAKLDFLERNRLLSLNNNHAYVGSGGIGYSRELPQSRHGDKGITTHDLWCLFESQETVGISPQQFEEFVFPYQLALQERFGLNCYGCCEPLDARWHVVRKTPRLRRVSVSPWADQAKLAGLLQADYIFSRKAPPSFLAVRTIEEEAARADVRKTLELAKGCVLEIIMKDNHTLGGNPGNLVRWVQIAREEIDRVGWS